MKNLIIYVLIGLSLFLLFKLYQSSRATQNLTNKIEYYTDSLRTYTSLYSSASFQSLKNENRELYNEVKRLKNLKEVIQFKYRTEYKTDTIYTTTPGSIQSTDTTYRLSHVTDSISYNLLANVSGRLNYYKLDFKFSDDIRITRQESEDLNKLNISAGTGTIGEVTSWKKKKPRFNMGLIGGVGYGIVFKKPDLFIGIGFSYNLF